MNEQNHAFVDVAIKKMMVDKKMPITDEFVCYLENVKIPIKLLMASESTLKSIASLRQVERKSLRMTV